MSLICFSYTENSHLAGCFHRAASSVSKRSYQRESSDRSSAYASMPKSLSLTLTKQALSTPSELTEFPRSPFVGNWVAENYGYRKPGSREDPFSETSTQPPNLAVQALQICVISMAELVKLMKLIFPILMRFMASGEPLWASFFRHRKYRYV